jgi:Mg2+/citrate symporter
MYWHDLPLHPTAATLRRFGGLTFVILTGIAVWQLVQERLIAAIALFILALVLGVFAAARPTALWPLFVGMSVAAFPVNWVVAHLILALIFFGVFTPVALFFRLVGRDVLLRRRRPNAKSYWSEKPQSDGVRSYFRQT